MVKRTQTDPPGGELLTHLSRRFLGERASEIQFEIDPECLGGASGYRLEPGRVGASARLRIVGDTPLAAAAGLYEYLKKNCHIHLSWCGSQTHIPEGAFPGCEARKKAEERRFPFQLRPYLNFCTFGYSMVWWDEARWMEEIDFMALNGINMPLALTGMEAVWQKTFARFGVDAFEMRHFLSGPAFLPWQYMVNLEAHAGPLPQEWIDEHLLLGQKILARERAWGMTPMLPGFNGHVPQKMMELYPSARFIDTKTWCHFPALKMLNPADPLYREVSRAFLEELIAAFGSDHYYAIDLFHEQEAPDESAEYLSSCARNVMETLDAVDSRSIWVMQAWSERPAILKAVPRHRLLMLDIGKERLKATDGMFGIPTVWGTIHSFGGQTEIGGDLAAIPREIAEQKKKYPNLIGAGAFPESIFNNPVLYELVWDCALQEKNVDLASWIADYVTRRYGVNHPAAQEAWRLLQLDVYTARRGDTVFAARPELHLDRANAWSQLNPDDVPERFFPAWETLLEAGAALRNVSGYAFDVVDLGRQALSSLGMVFYRRIQQAFFARNLAEFRRAADDFMSLLLDSDRLLGTRREFRLDAWLYAARSWGEGNRTLADLYEYNARLQLTLWGPVSRPEPLFDYCCRDWHGLLSGYYGVRWSRFFDFLETKLRRNEAYDDRALPRLEGRLLLDGNDFYRDLYRFEESFVHETLSDGAELEIAEDAVSVAEELAAKYRKIWRMPRENRELERQSKNGDLLRGFNGDLTLL